MSEFIPRRSYYHPGKKYIGKVFTKEQVKKILKSTLLEICKYLPAQYLDLVTILAIQDGFYFTNRQIARLKQGEVTSYSLIILYYLEQVSIACKAKQLGEEEDIYGNEEETDNEEERDVAA